MLTIETQEENGHNILLLKGEVDASNSVILDEAITKMVAGGSNSILVDGSGLEYISSAGLGVFMSYLEDFQEKAIDLKIYSLSDRVFEVFKILGLDQLMRIYPDKKTALLS
ncbi:STAS domain-containing protein [Algoriphagus persicinus]|uniref:STAS domain-containing protein n=1 Tax=Algoriphagus persicinus TaxID=3108754 RepID=UPI002B3F601E|nr:MULTISPECIES: STAS domain-containing protein [unclassified Algoriphagus]MEB2780383.1 STAS domain-containing protein [Algoriphagus sp. C2-6-M1]MEB2784585.1 STAS domain-containing protein [Algoriphagus sp. E1-3-M2]